MSLEYVCGGKCGDPSCKFEGKSSASVQGHVYGKRASAKRHRAVTSVTPSGTPTPTGETFYPSELRPLPPPPGQAKPAAPTAVPPKPVFSTEGIWLAVGAFCDDVLKKAGKKPTVNMTVEKARAMDASLQAMGWTTAAPTQSVVMPYWAPFIITAVSTFVLPMMLAFLPDLIERARKMGEERRERRKERERERPAEIARAAAGEG